MSVLLYSFVFVSVICSIGTGRTLRGPSAKFINPNDDEDYDIGGIKYAVLIAGSRGWDDYADQADVCHAYQILRKGGLEEENIIVFMYDDIATHPRNPTPNQIIHRPGGPNVYQGVKVDYRGGEVTAANVLAVLNGDKDGILENRKFLLNKENDKIFIYYSGHGDKDFIGMPVGPVLTANELFDALKYTSDNNKYDSVVIYLQSCKSGSMFLNPFIEDYFIYSVTSATSTELSYRTYYSKDHDTYLATQFGASWMEDWERYNNETRKLQSQYEAVRDRMALMPVSSHPTQLGDKGVANSTMDDFMGHNVALKFVQTGPEDKSIPSCSEGNLILLRNRLNSSRAGSEMHGGVKKELDDALATMKRVDDNFDRINKSLFVHKNKITNDEINDNNKNVTYSRLNHCFTSLMHIYYKHCGSLTKYGMWHSEDFHKMCDSGVTESEMIEASVQACSV